jgi:hypothetical protein
MLSLGPKNPSLGSDDEDSLSGALCLVTVASGGTIELLMLMRSNYHDWSLIMKVSLEALGLWEAVEADKAEHREDRLALAAILRAVSVDMKASLAVKKTAKEAWAAVKVMRMGDTRMKEANAQRLLKEFENIVAMDGESIEDLATHVIGLVSNLQELGEKMEDRRIVRKLLHVVPKRYNQIACDIEMFSYLNTMSIEELIGKLQAAEERVTDEEVATASAGMKRLLLTQEQWEARHRQHASKNHTGHDSDDDGSSSTSSISRRGKSRYHGCCFNCGERRHMARDCHAKKKEKALLIDDEPALL